MILVSVTLAVAAIPEGIPLCVTISLLLDMSAVSKAESDVNSVFLQDTNHQAHFKAAHWTPSGFDGKI